VSIGAIPRLLFALFLLRPIILPESAAEPVAAWAAATGPMGHSQRGKSRSCQQPRWSTRAVAGATACVPSMATKPDPLTTQWPGRAPWDDRRWTCAAVAGCPLTTSLCARTTGANTSRATVTAT